jgi:hypothetical protein
MPVYKKQGDIWTPAARVYVKDANVQKPADQVWVKYNGIWTKAHEYDVTPPPAPVIVVELVEFEGAGRYLKVGVTLNAPDAGLRRIRVLTSYMGKMPTTQYGGNYVSAPDATAPNEPWSDFYFNGFEGSQRLPHELYFKTWPRSATSASGIVAGPVHFAAWAEDSFGNWSTGYFKTFDVPRRENVVGGTGGNAKDKRFLAVNTGIWSGGEFSYGRPTQAKGPIRRGLFFYGGAIKDDIGKSGKAKIKKAQIRIERRNDGGTAQANVYLAYHNFGQPQNFAQNASWSTPVKLGKISKGEAKWFDIPKDWYSKIEKDEIKGFLLNHKDPDKADAQANDYSVMNSKADSVRTGELHVVWTES